MGDMERMPDSVVRVGGRVAYAAQTAFIINETVRENVLFGLPFDEPRYDQAVYAADLKSDFKVIFLWGEFSRMGMLLTFTCSCVFVL